VLCAPDSILLMAVAVITGCAKIKAEIQFSQLCAEGYALGVAVSTVNIFLREWR